MSGHCDVCKEDIEEGGLEGILDHLRVMHPDIYGDGPPRWPDGGLVIDESEIADDMLKGDE